MPVKTMTPFDQEAQHRDLGKERGRNSHKGGRWKSSGHRLNPAAKISEGDLSDVATIQTKGASITTAPAPSKMTRSASRAIMRSWPARSCVMHLAVDHADLDEV